MTVGLGYYGTKHGHLAAGARTAEQPEITRQPIHVAGVNEPLELLAVSPKVKRELTPADKALKDALEKTGGGLESIVSSGALNSLIAAYPNFGEARAMRATGLCTIPGSSAATILSDIDAAVKHPPELDPSVDWSLIVIRAKLEHDSGHDEQAMADLEKAISANPSSPWEVLNNGGTKPSQPASSRCAWSEDSMTDLVHRYPNDYRSYLFRGLFNANFGPYDEQSFQIAKQDIERAIFLDKDSGRLHYDLADMWMYCHFFKRMESEEFKHSENPAVLRELNLAIELDPKIEQAWTERANLYFQGKQYSQAISDYERVLQLDPTNFTALHDQALSKLNSGDLYGAISGFQRAIEAKKTKREDMDALPYENLGNAYMKTHQYEEAADAYTNALGAQLQAVTLMNIRQFRRIFPEYAPASDDAIMHKIQQTYEPQVNYDEFAKGFSNADKRPFETFLIKDLYLERADSYLLAGKYRSAAVDYQRAVHSFEHSGADAVERWHSIGGSGNEDTLLDLRTADFSQRDAMTVWIKNQSKTPVSGSGEHYSIEKYAINCQTNQIRLLSHSNYNNGAVFSSPVSNPWQSITPDSLGEVLSGGMCAAR